MVVVTWVCLLHWYLHLLLYPHLTHRRVVVRDPRVTVDAYYRYDFGEDTLRCCWHLALKGSQVYGVCAAR